MKLRIFPFAFSARRANISKLELIGSIAMSFRKKVLLVDDELDAVEAMSLLPELEGYDVRVAGSGADALKAVETILPDVAFIDEKMPQMSGRELAGVLRGSLTLRGMRMIALSGFNQDADVQRSKNAGFDLHLTKPVSVDEIIRAIENR
ncbi:response regulator [Paraburkholderia fungorum]|uniref:response regulator n=1 Tax=Paraburkholderia fungorum TaxID=134537 RepID=UPI0038BBCC7F